MHHNLIVTGTDVAGSPPGEYAQEVPTRKPGEKPSGPPILPPHLLQVILNKDTPAHVSMVKITFDGTHDYWFSFNKRSGPFQEI